VDAADGQYMPQEGSKAECEEELVKMIHEAGEGNSLARLGGKLIPIVLWGGGAPAL
jgi:hypothetical protein